MKISKLAILAALPLLTSCGPAAMMYALVTPHKEAEGLKEAETLIDEAADYEIHQLDPTVK